MKRNTELGHITPAGANIFADLGFEPDEAVQLLEERNKIISEKLSIKESLMTEPCCERSGVNEKVRRW